MSKKRVHWVVGVALALSVSLLLQVFSLGAATHLMSDATGTSNSPESIEQKVTLDYKEEEIIPGEIVVEFKGELGSSAVEVFAKNHDLEVLKVYKTARMAVFGSSSSPLDEKMIEIASEPFVRSVSPNGIVHSFYTPNDPLFSTQQWGPQRINATYAWNYTLGNSSVVLAILDTGVDYNHEDLSANMWKNAAEESGVSGVDDDLNGYVDDIYGWNFHNDTNDPMDDNDRYVSGGGEVLWPIYHGTHCAGIAAAVTNNSKGIAGIAQVRIMAVKVLGRNGTGTMADLSYGIRYAYENGADIISMSLGSSWGSLAVKNAAQDAWDNGTILFAASGNENASSVDYPARYATVIAVGATNQNDERCDPSDWPPDGGSNYGTDLELMAPGDQIMSARRTSPYYQKLDGTSQATPHAAGAAALLMSEYPSLTNMQVRLILRNTTVDLGDPGWDQYYGYGLVDVYKAILETNFADRSQKITTLGDDKFSFDVNTEHYGIVAIKSVDHYLNYPYNLDMYDSPTYLTSLAHTESYPDGDIAFIVVNGHELTSNQTFYPRVTHRMSGYHYIIEIENGTGSGMVDISLGVPVIGAFSSTEIVDAYQIKLQTGVTYDVSLDIQAAVNLDLYAICGNMKTDEDAVRSISTSGGVNERLVFAATTNGYCVVVVGSPTDQAAGYTLKVDTLSEDEAVDTHLLFGPKVASYPELAMEVNTGKIGVVAVKGVTFSGSNEYNLDVYNNPSYLSSLANSKAYQGNDMAFILIDGHKLLSNTTYYPKVTYADGYEYIVEMENGTSTGVVDLGLGSPQAGSFRPPEIIDVYQIFLKRDMMYDAKLAVPSGSDFNLYAACGDLVTEEQSIGSISTTPGEDERLVFATNRTGYCGIIVTNPFGGDASYSLVVEKYTEDNGVATHLIKGDKVASSKELVMDVDPTHYGLVAIKSISNDGTNPWQLDLYDNPSYVFSLANAQSYPNNDIAYLAVDGHTLGALTTFYPKVTYPTEGKEFALEIENGSLTGVANLTMGIAKSGSFTSSDLVNVYQAYLEEGTTYDVNLVVPSGSNFDLYALCGDRKTDQVSVRSVSPAPGQRERLVFAPNQTGYCAFVVGNPNADNGAYTISVDGFQEDTGVQTHLLFGGGTASYPELAMRVIPSKYAAVGIKSVSHYGDYPYNLDLYDNPNYLSSLANSQSYPDNDIAFVVMDGHNLAAEKAYYPKVTHRQNGYVYLLEIENGSSTGVKNVTIGTPQTGDFVPAEVLDVFQATLTAGVSYNISLNVPLGYDYDLYLLRGDYATEETALASSKTRFAGRDEYITYVPAVTDDYCIVVTNPLGGNSFYTLSISTADLSISQSDITFSNPTPMEGDTIAINATVWNLGSLGVLSADAKFFDGDPYYNIQIGQTRQITNLLPSFSLTIGVDWDTTNLAGNHTIFVALSNVDPPDADGSNDVATKDIIVIPTPTNEMPTISITSPTPGEEVVGLVTVSGVANDPDGTVARVEVKIDTGAWTNANGTAAWTYDWNTTYFTNGPHTIFARAFDGLIYSQVASVGVLVNNSGGQVNLPPTAVVLSDPTNITDHSMKLNWTENMDSDFASYEVYRSTSSGDLGTMIAFFTDRLEKEVIAAGLNSSVTYYFTVRVVDSGGLYNDSNQVNGTTLPSNTPPSPVFLQNPFNETAHSLTLGWTESADLDFAQYEIYRSLSSGVLGNLEKRIANRTATNYISPGLLPNTTYYYVVRVVDIFGLYSDSNQANGTTLMANEPPSPVVLGPPLDITESTMTLQWSESLDSDFARYEVYESTVETILGSRVSVISSRSSTTFVATNLSPLTTYYFTVRVVDTGNLSSDSNQVNATTLLPNQPPTPVMLSTPFNITSKSMSLSWTQNVDLDFARYEVYQSLSGGSLGSLIFISPNRTKTVCIAGGLDESTTYFFKVRVIDTGGLKADSNQAAGTTLRGNAAPSPVVLENPSNITSYTMTLKWSESTESDFVSYEIYQSEVSGDTGSLIHTIGWIDVTQYTVTSLSESTTYYFTVRVVDSGGLFADSNQVFGTTQPGNQPPSSVILYDPQNITESSMEIRWSENPDTDFARYEIYLSQIPTEIGAILDVLAPRTATRYIAVNLMPGTTYYFTVRVVDSYGLFTDSNQVSGSTLVANSPPAAVSLSDPTDITSNSMALSWTQSVEPDFARYEIYQSLTSGVLGSPIQNISDRNTTSVVLVGLQDLTTYYFVVRTYDTGLLYADSNQVSGSTVASNVAPMPVSLQDPTQITNSSMTLTWSQSNELDFARYDLYRSLQAGEIGEKFTSISSQATVSHIVTGLLQNTVYYFTVRVYDTGGLFSDSNMVSGKTLRTNTPPMTVSLGDPVDITAYSMTLTWTQDGDYDFARYELYVSINSSEIGWLVFNTTSRGSTRHVVSGLHPMTTYFFIMRVVDTGGLTSESNQVTGRTEMAAISPPGDSDADGLPDDWENKYFGSLSEGPGGDPDNDERPNLLEYYEGTDPTVPDEEQKPGLFGEPLSIILLVVVIVLLIALVLSVISSRRAKERFKEARQRVIRQQKVLKAKAEEKELLEDLVPPPPPPEF